MNLDDPKLTAYALDELAPAERAEIEQLLCDDPAARAELEETAAFAARLRRELKAEPTAPLTDSQRAVVLTSAALVEPAANVIRPAWWRCRVPVALAASIAVLFGGVMLLGVRSYFGATASLSSAGISDPRGWSDVGPFDRLAIATGDKLTGSRVGAELKGEAPEFGGAKLDGRIVMSAPIPSATPPPGMQIVENSRFSGRPSSPVFQSVSTANGRIDAPRFAAMKPAAPGEYLLLNEPGFAKSGALPSDPGVGNSEAYDTITDNAFLAVAEQPLSTFSIDVDTASYANVRRFLTAQTLPPPGAVRIEELLNYFTYDYPQPEGDAPFSSTMEVAACPWEPAHRLVRIGLKGREIQRDKRPASNLAFLIDVSGSMSAENKLPLVKQSLQLLVDQLSPEDTVSIAVYAGASGTVLEPTHDRRAISAALDRLHSGGSTNGAAGIQLAYRLAEQAFIKGGANRVILATDGDFNVGVTSQDELVRLIEAKAKSGVFLTVLGFGMGNLKDSTLEKLADKGNGNYAYIDTLREGRKVLVEQMTGTLVTIAKDVKIQVEFNPEQVAAYRLIGYENRLLAKEDFNDDKKDAGEIGAGHTVTALYEIVPAGQRPPGTPSVDPLKYQRSATEAAAIEEKIRKDYESGQASNRRISGTMETSAELLTLKLRYKQPDSDTSKLLTFPLTDRGETWEKSSRDFRFAAAVAGFGLLLRDSPHKGSATWSTVRELAVEGQGDDRSGYRREFLTLIDQARTLAR